MSAAIRISVLANARDAIRGLRDTSDAMGGLATASARMKNGFSGLQAAGAVFAGSALVAGLKGAVDAASDLNETVSKSSTIFGKQSASIDAWARGAASSIGLSRQAALDAASGFGDMFSQLGASGAEAAKLSQATVQMAADLGSFNNLPTAEVADKISGAYRGEFDSLQALIPNISAARVEQVALSLSHKKAVSSLTAMDKALAVNSILQKDGARAVGDFARTSSGAANQQKILAARLDNVKATIGTALLPAYRALLAGGVAVTDWVATKAIPWLQDKLPTAFGAIKTALAPLAAAMEGAFSGFVSVMGNPVFQTFAAAVLAPMAVVLGVVAVQAGLAAASTAAFGAASAVVSGVTRAWTAAQWLLNAAMAANPIGLVILALVAVGAALVVAWQRSETFRAVVTGAFGAVRDFATGAWSAIVSAATAAWSTITGAVSAAASAVKAVMSGVQAAAAAVWNAVKSVAEAVWSGISALVKIYIGVVIAEIRAVLAVATAVWGAVKAAAQAVWSAVSAVVRAEIQAVKDAVRGVVAVASGVWEAIKGAASRAWAALAGLVGDKVDEIRAKVVGVKDGITSAFSGAGTLLLDAGRRVIDGLWTGLRDKWEGVKAWFGHITSQIPSLKGPASRDASLLTGAGRLVMDGFLAGLEDRYQAVRASLGGFTSSLGASVALRGSLDFSGASTASTGAASAVQAVSRVSASGGAARNVAVSIPPADRISTAEQGRAVVEQLAEYSRLYGPLDIKVKA